MKKTIYFVSAFSLVIICAWAAPLRAQVPGIDRAMTGMPDPFDFENAEAAESATPANPWVPSYGLIITAYDINKDKNNILNISARPWLSINLGRKSRALVRGKYSYSRFLASQPGLGAEDKHVYDVDVGYLETESSLYSFRLGRQLFMLGQGILLNGKADGVDAVFRVKMFELRLFGSYTGLLMKDNNPFKISDADISEGAKRLFSGATFGARFKDQNAQLIFLYEKDFAKNDGGVYYEYSVGYTAINMTGSILPGFHYTFEGIFQFGKSHTNGTETTADVLAYAASAGLFYFIKHDVKPKLLLEFAVGSGDEDRINATSPIGNIAKKDYGFIAFGTFQRGMALNPSLGNLIVFDTGFSIIPFGFINHPIAKQLIIAGKYYKYWKTVADGGINGSEATSRSADVGDGVDATLGWRFTAELSLTAGYGYFHPGSAFPSGEKERHMVMTGLSLSI